jgi:5S rRNA maturation endonuclease (ribonuclease M5)
MSTNIPKLECKKCGFDDIIVVEGKWGPHNVKKICRRCNKFHSWGAILSEQQKAEKLKKQQHYRQQYWREN